MPNANLFTNSLAVLGTLFVWLPLVAPLAFGAVRLVQRGRLMFDYLMPAELFPVALLGGGLLIWAAARAHMRLRLIAGALTAAVLLLVSTQVLAVVTGLASGAVEAAGWPLAVVVGGLVVYIGCLLALAVGGVLLVQDLRKQARAAAA